jgi:8-oxo-dGTP diphosphatase
LSSAMASLDGNGWARCALGHRHWGLHGAAGLLLYAPAGPGEEAAGSHVPGEAAAGPYVLLQHRAAWSHHGGTWGLPGGARDSHEDAVSAALREAAEECGLDTSRACVTALSADDHGGWSYQTVIARADSALQVGPVSRETSAARWLPAATVGARDLHPGFAARWPLLRDCLVPLTVIVDVANVMGSRAGGWWRDRSAAAARLMAELDGLAAAGLGTLPAGAGLPAVERWFPQFAAVLEGTALDVLKQERLPGVTACRVRAVAAPGSGDDMIAELAADLPGRRLVVTADAGLRARCLVAGASVAGPRWLLGLL